MRRRTIQTDSTDHTKPLQYTVDTAEAGLKVIDILATKLMLSGRSIRRAKQNNLVALNEVFGSVNRIVQPGDRVAVFFLREENIFEPENIRFDICFEDDDLLVVNKPPFLVVHPTKGHPTGTLGNAVAYHQLQRGEHYKIRFINRLDRDTSGLLLIAKNANAQQRVSEQMKAGTVSKTYLALVEGSTPSSETIDAPIDRLSPDDILRGVTPHGLPSITRYRTLETHPISALHRQQNISSVSLVELDLLTGRTHQIRVHMAYIGHPVLGDTLYGHPSPWIPRQALHCCAMEFVHPRTGEPLRFKVELPKDIRDALRMIRF
ncbi:MAG: RluA family pseudouridine synthase [Bacillota bacterium]|nr:RluA family pseudouridine synthase [Bacillota bacterium]